MKKIKYPALAIGLLFLVHCKSTKTSSSETTKPNTVATFTPSTKQLEVVEKRWAGTPISDVSEGQTIFTTKCTACHQAYEITGFSEKKWLHEIDDMSPKAKLTPEEKLKLTKHILSYREANTVAKTN